MANDDLKIYTPDEIQDAPFPNGVDVKPIVTQNTSGGTYSPKTTQEQSFPEQKVATELLSQDLNTRTKKILSSFEFAPSGAIQIGQYKQGDSGDIRISPNGIVARDQLGDTTFALDGDTGDAIFKGTVRASRFENDLFSVDEMGNVIANSIKISSLGRAEVSGGSQQITGTTETTILNSTITFTLERSTIVMILLSYNGYAFQSSGSGDWYTPGTIRLYKDGADTMRCFLGGYKSGSDTGGNVNLATVNMHFIREFAKGSHTVYLTGQNEGGSGNGAMAVYGFVLSLITLGNA